MPDRYLPAPGASASIDALVIPYAQQLAKYLAQEINPYAHFIGATICGDGAHHTETIIFDVEVELSQVTKFDIHGKERISVSFCSTEDTWPEVLALREDFPLVPHLNLRQVEFPRSLCLYEQPFSEAKLHWTSVSVVERVRFWLSQTAQATLHKQDQPLEHLFLGTRDAIVLPPDIYARTTQGPVQLHISYANREPWGHIYIAQYLTGNLQVAEFVAATYRCPPVLHGVLSWTPQTLSQLQSAVLAKGGDLLNSLREQVSCWPRDSRHLGCRIVLILIFPKARNIDGAPEAIETHVFVTNQTIAEIGEVFGIWALTNGIPGQLLGGTIDQKRLQEITLFPLNPTFGLTRQGAATVTGSNPDLRKIVAIGMGALGSQVVNILVRSGFGLWSLLDSDVLLPHNVSRHCLVHAFVGMPKAEAMRMHLNATLAEPSVEHASFVDVLDGKKEKEIDEILGTSDIVLDFSASIPVARKLAHNSAQGRRASVFMNPSGSSSVLLAEDTHRLTKLDSLEMQYYRAILSRPELANHFVTIDQVRYGTSCRDVSNTLPAHQVALHAAVVSMAIKSSLSSESACIRVWTANEEGAINSLNIQSQTTIEREIGQWKLITDVGFMAKLRALRTKGLPEETGGVLLGTWDFTRGIVYVADTIPAPTDSKRCKTSFIRGCQGLLEQVAQARNATAGMLQYVGEWHSHPKGYGTTPSNDDCKLFEWIAKKTTEDGYSPVMAIVDEFEARWFVESISSRQHVTVSMSI